MKASEVVCGHRHIPDRLKSWYATIQPSTRWIAIAGIGRMTVADPAEKDEVERLSPWAGIEFLKS
jgi:hypothetical protein